jgi:hypothetical protein
VRNTVTASPAGNNKAMTDIDGLGTPVGAGSGDSRDKISHNHNSTRCWWKHTKCLVCYPSLVVII